MTTRHLRDIDVDEISLVSKAATRKKFMIIKNQGGVDTVEDILKDFIVNFSEDEDVEDFQKAESEDKLREKLRESLKEIQKFEEDLPDSLRKAISTLAQWAYKGYGYGYPGAGKKPIKKDDPFYWKSFDVDGEGKEEIEKIKKRQSGEGEKWPSVVEQLFGTDDEE